MTRTEQIAAGKVWQVYPGNDIDSILFEGTKAACVRYVKDRGFWKQYKRGVIRIGQLIWDPETTTK